VIASGRRVEKVRTATWTLVIAALAFGSGCAKTDWIGRTLVTVDVTGSWYGRASGQGAAYGMSDLLLDLQQEGSTVKGSLRLRATSGTAAVSGPIEGTVTGDVFRFKNMRGTVEGELTVSVDEMQGVISTEAGRRSIALQRVDPSSPPGSSPRQ
jgi:hypothetical protein